jgi:multicomponent Na+:H+ antiporter subunit G
VTWAVAASLLLAVAAAWLGAIAFLRMRTPLDRLHVVTFVNVAAGGFVVLAALLTEGITARTLKCVLIWVAAMLLGACLSHATGRALHLRDGERR